MRGWFLLVLMAPCFAFAAADLSISQTDRLDPVGFNVVNGYDLVVSNRGPDAATGVVVTNFWPRLGPLGNTEELKSSTECGGGGVTADYFVWNIGGLAVGEVRSCAVLTSVEHSPWGPGGECFINSVLTNRATVVGLEPDPNLGNNLSVEETALLPKANLFLGLGGPGVVDTNEVYDYELFVENTGPCDAANVEARFVVPEETAFVDAPGGALSGGVVLWSFPAFPFGMSTTLTVTVRARVTNALVVAKGSIMGDVYSQGGADTELVRVGRNIPLDFDGDFTSDLALFDPVTRRWAVRLSAGGLLQSETQGAYPIPAPADYDDDATANVATYDLANGNWSVLGEEALGGNWGYSGALPVPADYDSDDRTDLAVFEPATGNWYVRKSPAGAPLIQNWGYSKTIPVPGDYDGDGASDFAVFEPASGNWYVLGSTAGFTLQNWGYSRTSPVPADYDGDGRTDRAVYEPATGTWYLLGSTTGLRIQQWGYSETIPVPADYDGDGLADICVYEPASGNWYLLLSEAGFLTFNLGAPGIPAATQFWLNVLMGQ